MITVNVDMSNASDRERESFLALPMVAGAIDTLSHTENRDVRVRLTLVDEQGNDTQGFATQDQ